MQDKYVGVKGGKIHIIEEGNGEPFLLFHGARFNAHTWVETKTLESVANAGYRAISVDLPGFGKSAHGDFVSLSSFIRDLTDALGLSKAYLLGASMGGEAVLGFAVDNPDIVDGLVLVGAVGVSAYKDKLESLVGKRILLIWGEKDSVSPRSNAELIMMAVNTTKLVMVGKQHACYLDDNLGFNNAIVNFLKGG